MANHQAMSNLDPILYRLQAPRTYGLARYPPLRYEDGRIFTGPGGETYQDFTWLPRNRFTTCPSALEIETWNRFHPQCSYSDIEARMAPGAAIPSRNALNMKRMREVRLPLGILCWVSKTTRITVLDCLTAEQLTTDGVDFNTILDVDYATGALVTPAWARGNPLFPTIALPWDSFLVDGQKNIPCQGLKAILYLMAHLQNLAQDQQLPHWLFLPNHMKPHWWSPASSPPDDITLPGLCAIPHWSRRWLKQCVREAATPNNPLGLRVPSVEILPPSSRGWIHECIIQGRGSISSANATDGSTSIGSSVEKLDGDELELDTIGSSPSPRPSPFAGLNHPSRHDDSQFVGQTPLTPILQGGTPPRPTTRRASAYRRQHISEDKEDDNEEESWEGFSDGDEPSAHKSPAADSDVAMEEIEDN